MHNTFLDKVAKVTYGKGDWIEFTYDGSGALIKRENSNGDYWEYAGKSGGVPLIFKNGQPYSFAIPEGRAIFEGGQWKPEFEYRDVWNNLRVVFGADGNRLVRKQQSDYDVWGAELYGIGTKNPIANNFEFQGKEKIDWVNWHDFGARMYSAPIGRFLSVDAAASDMPAWSPYNAFKNNPLRYIDPDGNAPLDVIILFNKSNGRLSVMDLDHYQKGLPTRRVSANDYVHGGIRDSEGKLTHNQVLSMDNFFSGEKATDGNISRDLISDPSQLPIPNGRYDLLEYEGRDGWYKVDAIDNSRYDDHHQGQTNAQGKTRSGYRLHQGTLSHGCITCDVSQGDRQKEWDVFETILENTSKTSVPMREGSQKFNPFSTRLKYGEIKVTGTDEIKKD